ncbi:DUF6702 family protein [Siphonobacter sp. SORGH_AS_1065]|uniref:DUF6702 family protein n=1 Tax=Siphonobacter sp. SORGH_AS_1065 TaxID=3041795 RepID=UPI00278150F9|nr:DUF6702 family protein [Siphonobacter sp. SORGH_AS_1065]MDQ1087955.1 hypothetical protein [Siphonobacter sp. SORGH_AS_1065]
MMVSKLNRWLIYSLLVIGFSGITAFDSGKHDFHNSLTEMRYNPKNKAFEVEIKLFTDDLETALNRGNKGPKIRILDKDANDKLVEAYVRKHYKFTNAAGAIKPYQYVGKQNEMDATWVFIEMPFSDPIKGCKLQQSALTDVFDDQQNIVNLNFNGDKKYFLFNEKVLVRVIE